MEINRLSLIKPLSFSIILLSNLAFSQETEVEAVEVYTPARLAPNSSLAPVYPPYMAQSRREAWVQVSFMIDEQGEVFDPAVVSSSAGGEGFYSTSLRAINRAKYVPAQLHNEPIVSSETMRYVFSLVEEDDPGQGASRRFVKKYQKYMEEVSTGNKEDLRLLLDELIELGIKSHYEEAFLNWAHYAFANRFGTPREQLDYLDAALSSPKRADDHIYLSSDIVNFAGKELFTLQVRNNRFVEALATYNWLGEIGDTEAIELLGPSYESLLELQNSEFRYGMDVTLEESGYGFIGLFKQSILFENVEGKIDEVRVRCSQGYVAFTVDVDLSYAIPESLGKCYLQIMGQPGSNFTLVQY